eukprot:2228907-Prymnesium_polylepis.1
MNGIVDGGGGGSGDCGWVVGRPLFVVSNVMCDGWLWLSDGVPDSHCFTLFVFRGLFRATGYTVRTETRAFSQPRLPWWRTRPSWSRCG